MKFTFLTSLFLILVLAYQVSAEIYIIDNLLAYKKNLDNLKKEVNLAKDISVGGSSKAKVDLYYDKKDTNNLKPVVIYFHPGSWVTGDKHEFSKLGSLLIKDKYVAVLANYILFPSGKIDDMVNDVYKTIQWTYKNITKYGGDKSRITVVGYSAGAHLSALTLIKSYLHMENKGVILDSLPPLEKMVLISGPYDFDDLDGITQFITGSSSDVDNGIAQKLASALLKSKDIGPTDIIRTLKSNSVESFGVPQINFFYSDADTMVPESSANNFMKEIRRVSPSTIINYVFNEGQNFKHHTLILGARTDDKVREQMFLELIHM